MLGKHWQKLFREETQMDAAGSWIWAFVIFGGTFGLGMLYLSDTRTHLGSVTKATISTGAFILFGALAAQWRWVRLLSEAAVLLLIALWILRPFFTG